MQTTPQSSIELPGIKKLRSGKVREVFDLGDTLLLVVSDRLSAFDVILPDPIPYKGAVLNQISAFWFQKLDFAKNHFITANFDEFPQSLRGFRDQLAGRSMLVKKTEPLTIECVVRGYLAGSGWKDYQENGSVCNWHRNYRARFSLRQPRATSVTTLISISTGQVAWWARN